MAAPQAAAGDPALSGATLRLIVRPQLTGSEVRIRLSNAYGDAPLVIGAASVARVDGRRRGVGHAAAVTFDGRPRVTIPAGQDLVSDPVPLVVEAGRALAVSIHLSSAPAGRHGAPGRPADLLPVRARRLHPDAGRRTVRHPDQLLAGAHRPRRAAARARANAVVAVGDSITDGFGSKVNADQRWTDALARRLADAGGPATMAVLNAGLSANQLLADDPQRAGVAPIDRFERDVAAVAGATDVVLHIGTNDIAAGRSVDEITAGLQHFAEPGQGRSACASSSPRSRRRAPARTAPGPRWPPGTR